MAIERLQPRDGEKVLDIGCGNAMLTIDLAKRIPNGLIVGIEVSEEMHAQALKNLANTTITNITIVHTDALKIQYENEFDTVFSNSAIHWIEDQGRMYGLIYRALKTTGRIMVQTGMKENNSLFNALSKIRQYEDFRRYTVNFKEAWHLHSVKETEYLLTNAGFQNIRVEPYRFHMRFATQADMRDYCRAAALVPYLPLFPDEMKQTFEQKFLELLLSLNKPNPLEIVMTRLFIQAEKLH
jgi:trans-aconitate methyltransferase